MYYVLILYIFFTNLSWCDIDLLYSYIVYYIYELFFYIQYMLICQKKKYANFSFYYIYTLVIRKYNNSLISFMLCNTTEIKLFYNFKEIELQLY